MNEYLQKMLDEAKKQSRFMDVVYEALSPLHGYRTVNKLMLYVRREEVDRIKIIEKGIKGKGNAILQIMKTGQGMDSKYIVYSADKYRGVCPYGQVSQFEELMKKITPVIALVVDHTCTEQEARIRGSVLDKVPNAEEVLNDFLKEQGK